MVQQDGGATGTWTLSGSILTIRWPNRAAPGGFWVDQVELNADRTRYQGKNQRGVPITGVRGAGTGGSPANDPGRPGLALADSPLPPQAPLPPGELPAPPGGVDLRRLKPRPGELRLLENGEDLPPGPFWPEFSPNNVRGWRIGDPGAIKVNSEGIALSAGSGGNFLLTSSGKFKKGSLVIDLEAAEGTEAYLALRAHEGSDGWHAVTSRVDVDSGKVRVGNEALDFNDEERGTSRRQEFATGTLIPIKFEVNDKGTGLVFVRGKPTASENLTSGPADGWVGAAGVFVKSGTLLIHSLQVR
jgi:hypothetical protein